MPDPQRWAVVVVNWNHAEDTIRCLESVLGAQVSPRRIILVDNASSDDSVHLISSWAAGAAAAPRIVSERTLDCAVSGSDPWLVIIRAETGGSFAHNNNIALAYLRDCTDATDILLLNNDATVASSFFVELAAAAAAHPRAGLLTGTIFEDPARDRVWYAGGSVIPWRALVVHDYTVGETDGPRETGFVCGCAMLIPRRTLNTVGLLGECYDRIYCEDADYSLRVRAAGFPLIHAPRAHVYHKVGGTMGPSRLSARIAFWTNRHRAFLVRRNYTGWRKLSGLGYLAVTKPPRAALELLKGRPQLGWAVLAGTVSGLFSRAAHTR
jgi:GT2 family glycosyltransferase